MIVASRGGPNRVTGLNEGFQTGTAQDAAASRDESFHGHLLSGWMLKGAC